MTAVVHGFTVHALGPGVDKGVDLVDNNTDGGWPNSHKYLPRLEIVLISTHTGRIQTINFDTAFIV